MIQKWTSLHTQARVARFAFLFAFISLVALQAQTPFPYRALDAEMAEASRLSPSLTRTLSSFETWTLSNGIPVILMRGVPNRSRTLSLVIRGGAVASTPGLEGLESVALKSMARASRGWAYEATTRILDETSSSIAASSQFDYSIFTLATLDKYFDRLFPLWAGSLTSPSLTDEDIDQVVSEARLAAEGKKQDPWASTTVAVNEAFFAGHPYAHSPDGTVESLARIGAPEVRSWYRDSFSADRCFVVAVGAFDPQALRTQLEAGIASLPDRKLPALPDVPDFPISGTSSLRVVEFPQSRGVAYLRGDFAAPGYASAEFMPLQVGIEILSDLLFNVVRDKYGASYSPASTIRSFDANYGSIIIYKTTVAGKIKAYIDEAVATIARGECVSVDPKPEEGQDARMKLADALPAYRELFKSAYYESQDSNAGIAAQIALSVLQRGDYRAYLLDSARVDAVTAESIAQALQRYLLGGRFAWVVLGSKDAVAPVQEKEYLGFAR